MTAAVPTRVSTDGTRSVHTSRRVDSTVEVSETTRVVSSRRRSAGRGRPSAAAGCRRTPRRGCAR
jgi:hypothetical protein